MGIDIKNEPHGSATWGTGNASTDWNTAADKAGAQINAQNPNILIFVQGVANNPACSDNSVAHWNGGNFEPMNCAPLNKIPANKLVFSPHVYGPDVYNQSYFSAGNFPQNMPTIWDKQFGFLTSKGLTVVPGEWGGKFADDGGNAKDPILQTALMHYFASKHICNSFYWDWNPNSGDTGGILQNDWTSVWQNKLKAIQDYYAACH
jgi:endoglucanase